MEVRSVRRSRRTGGWALLVGLAAQDAAPRRDLAAELAALVDRPTAAARAEAARELAADDSITVEEWRAACRTFAPRGAAAPGTRVVEVELDVLGAIERTPVALHVPRGYEVGAPAPLLLVLHWTGGTGPQAIGTWRELADELGLALCAPSETGANTGYGYTPRERAVALAALRWARREVDVDEDRVFVTGVSRGGHLAWDLLLRYPDLWAGAAPMIGGPSFDPRGGRANLRYLENALGLTIHDLQGALDQEGLVWNVRFAFERLEELGATQANYHEFPDRGHAYDMGAVDWRAFFADARRDPRPPRVVRRFARDGEGRAAWAEVLAGKKGVEEVFTPTIRSSKFERMDEDETRRWMVAEADERTARLEAELAEPGRFEVSAADVARFRLLLEPDMYEPGERVVVEIRGRRERSEPRASAEVLLREFAERFDRRFLPVAEVVIEPR